MTALTKKDERLIRDLADALGNDIGVLDPIGLGMKIQEIMDAPMFVMTPNMKKPENWKDNVRKQFGRPKGAKVTNEDFMVASWFDRAREGSGGGSKYAELIAKLMGQTTEDRVRVLDAKSKRILSLSTEQVNVLKAALFQKQKDAAEGSDGSNVNIFMLEEGAIEMPPEEDEESTD